MALEFRSYGVSLLGIVVRKMDGWVAARLLTS
jgi:hypothetical protein